MSIKTRELTEAERETIVSLYKLGKKRVEIYTHMELPKSTVNNFIKSYKKTGSIKKKPRSGRPVLLTSREERSLVAKIRRNGFTTKRKLIEMIKIDFKKTVSATTISRILKKNGIKCCSAAKKPLISPKNIKKRLQYVKEYGDWTISDWNKVIFSDETKIMLYTNDGRIKVYRKKGERFNHDKIKTTVKFGGLALMVWGCMSAAGTGSLHFINIKMDAKEYKSILENNLNNSAIKLGMGRNFVFMHDNDPKHKSKLVTEFLKKKKNKGFKSPTPIT